MNRKIVLSMFVIAIIALALASWLIANQPENKISTVRIANFRWTSDWGTGPVGLLWGRSFNITLQNMGNIDVEGVSVDIKLLANNTEIWSETGLYGSGIIGYTAEYPNGFDGKLNASETIELRGGFMTRLDELEQAQDWGEKSFKVRVIMNDTVLDELPLPYT